MKMFLIYFDMSRNVGKAGGVKNGAIPKVDREENFESYKV